MTVHRPPGLAAGPSADDPALADLRRRYTTLQTPLTAASPRWNAHQPPADLDLAAFRADNAYLWQTRHGYAGPDPTLTYRSYAQYLRRLDNRRLLDCLGEDGAFGAITVPHTRPPLLSRDLLDSVNELCFLDRRWHLFDRPDLTVLDIGAGYGRLAHRMSQALAKLHRYYCLDAIPESTYLAGWYLHHRRVDRIAQVIPLDQLHRLTGQRIDLAVGIRSVTEIPAAVVRAWLDLVDHLAVSALYVIPNHSTRLHSHEPDGHRHNLHPELHRRGYQLTADEPLILNPTLRTTTGWTEHHLLYQRS